MTHDRNRLNEGTEGKASDTPQTDSHRVPAGSRVVRGAIDAYAGPGAPLHAHNPRHADATLCGGGDV